MTIVGLGAGEVDAIPHTAVAFLAGREAELVSVSAELAAALERLGVSPADGSAVIAAPDTVAWRLAQGRPGAKTLPARPALRRRAIAAELGELWDVTVRLRQECPWDREQTVATIVPHTLEEAYEVAACALAGPPDAKLIDELGDLLFQSYFLALLADEAGAGGLHDVARGIREKLIRRHPHVFGAETIESAEGVAGRWEAIKRDVEGRQGIFHDVPGSFPALLHARKVQRRAATAGFDFADWRQAWEKVDEEIGELRAELDSVSEAARAEAGDVLFALVNVLRLAGIDPELALRGASDRFRSRVELAETLAARDTVQWQSAGLLVQEHYYSLAKATIARNTP